MRLILVFVFLPTLPPQAASPAAVSLPAPLPALDRRVLAMGTEWRLHLEGEGDLGRASETALAEVARIEAACSTWNPDSAWSRLNRAQDRPCPLAEEWMALLEGAQAWSLKTEGAFDPVLMALVQAWGLREGGQTPDPERLSTARAASGWRLLELDAAQGTAWLRHPGAGLEEGAFLKGYALDALRKASGIANGWADAGGQILAWGRPLDVSIADPRDRQRPRLTLRLDQASLATSGTSERGGHLLDPRSGRPCPAWGAVAVVTSDAFAADVLSTALYVMGPEAGPPWAEREGFAAVFLLNDGTVRMTPAFRSLNPTLNPRETP